MCRLLAYVGQPITLEDLLIKPSNSLLAQSLHARESTMPTNGDGFGLGWYNPEISDTPGLFTDVRPAWNNRNLKHLARHISSPCFFSHVRAASHGGISEFNCHPFMYQNFLFMHNGGLGDFQAVRRPLRRGLDDEIYNWIQGETDSEHLFALFLQHLKQHGKKPSLLQMQTALKATVNQALEYVEQYGQGGHSYLNLCVTDGLQIVACRFTTDSPDKARTLHFTQGSKLHYQGSELIIEQSKPATLSIIASEKLNDDDIEWQTLPANHFIGINPQNNITLSSL